MEVNLQFKPPQRIGCCEAQKVLVTAKVQKPQNQEFFRVIAQPPKSNTSCSTSWVRIVGITIFGEEDGAFSIYGKSTTQRIPFVLGLQRCMTAKQLRVVHKALWDMYKSLSEQIKKSWYGQRLHLVIDNIYKCAEEKYV